MLNKEKILTEARNHLIRVCSSITAATQKNKESLAQSVEKFKKLSGADRIVESNMIALETKRAQELKHLQGSPYFVRCDVQFAGDGQETSLYFGKFGFDKESIYSWLAPASVMRFENPGDVMYKLPDGTTHRAKLLRKDQFLIVDEKIKFLSSEDLKHPRELIYQEFFSTRKSGFMLPEIVAQMEKAQDQVIRANHVGPFLISGPAGSGKTTLALHRVAYVAQSPELAHLYTSKTMIVFVQDNGTKDYFSHLLPELGIDDVLITTFSEWAFRILGIDGAFVDRYGETEEEKDLYEFQKLKALRNLRTDQPSLEKIYENFFDEQQRALFQKQKVKRLYDRIDLTILLKIRLQEKGAFSVTKEYYAEQKNGILKKKRGEAQLTYSLAVIDEFQNYMPEQLKIIRSCMNPKTQSVVYVGDMAQQVKLGTIRSWEEIDETMGAERQVVLKKVYRNTKNILRYIQKLGYQIEIPEQLKEGAEVREYATSSKIEEIKNIQQLIALNDIGSVGVLAKEQEYLVEFKEAFRQHKSVHVMTMVEAQGVEFDAVVLVGMGRDNFLPYNERNNPELAQEKKRINRDLLYVALTRPISQLHVMGREKLKL